MSTMSRLLSYLTVNTLDSLEATSEEENLR